MFDAGTRGSFAFVVVVPNILFDDYDPDQMRWLADIMFADSSASADALYPRNGGIRDLYTLRELFGKFTVCGRYPVLADTRDTPDASSAAHIGSISCAAA